MILNNKYYAIFISKINSIPTIVNKKQIRADISQVTYKNKSYAIDTNSPSYQEGRKFVYFIDLKGGQIGLSDSDFEINPEIRKKFFSDKIIQQLVSGLDKSPLISMDMIIMLILMGFGIAVGYIIGNYVPIGGG